MEFVAAGETFASGTGRMATATGSSITSDASSVGSDPYADSGSRGSVSF